MMKPKNVQVTASRAPTPVAEPAPVTESAPATKVGSGKPKAKPKPKPKNVSTKKARLKLTATYTKDGCEGKVLNDETYEPGAKLGVEIKRSLPKGQYACCAQIENMKADKVDIKFGKKAEQTWKDVDFPGNHTMKLTHIKKIPGGEHTVCADSFEGTFRISQ